jgi:hypothetical protein
VSGSLSRGQTLVKGSLILELHRFLEILVAHFDQEGPTHLRDEADRISLLVAEEPLDLTPSIEARFHQLAGRVDETQQRVANVASELADRMDRVLKRILSVEAAFVGEASPRAEWAQRIVELESTLRHLRSVNEVRIGAIERTLVALGWASPEEIGS